MRICLSTIISELNKHGCLLLDGDDPYHVQAALTHIRQQLNAKGYESGATLAVKQDADLTTLVSELTMASLFASKEWLQIQVDAKAMSAKLAKELLTILKQEKLLKHAVICFKNCDPKTYQKKWYQHFVQALPALDTGKLSGSRFHSWLQEQTRKAKLCFTPEALDYFAANTNQSCLQASNELKKLALTYQAQDTITVEALHCSLIGQAKDSIFNLLEKVWRGDSSCLTTLKRLWQSGEPPILIHWWLCKELRELCEISLQVKLTGQTVHTVMQRLGVWRKKQAAFIVALKRAPASHWLDCLAMAYDLELKIKGGAPMALEQHMQAYLGQLLGHKGELSA